MEYHADMVPYSAPVEDFLFVIRHVLDQQLPAPGMDAETTAAILEEAGKIATDVIQPINPDGEGPVLKDGQVRVPAAWRRTQQAVASGGWIGTSQSPDYGGQGLPVLLNSAILEIFCSASMAFGLGTALTEGAIETLEKIASEELKKRYIPSLVSGAWMGTMNLTEPQAGSDLSALATKAVPDGNCYRITGQKVYISFGDHDMADNIIHLVLARLPDAPCGVKGISLFLVPKILVNDDGSPGTKNDVAVVSLEHKMGLHGSPTVSLQYGENGGAVGYLIGKENRGLEYMFIMMNRERHMCGVQAVGVAEMALQVAQNYANERVQGIPLGGKKGDPVSAHPDVRRMLLTMEAYVQAMRALACVSAAMMDAANVCDDPAIADDFQKISEVLTPVVKAWCSDVGFEVASTGMQVCGGLGYMEQTGMAQYLRDVRITAIYEGTNGIQANDLVFRKVLRDNGETVRRMLDWMQNSLSEKSDEIGLKRPVTRALVETVSVTENLIEAGQENPGRAAAVAVPYLHLIGTMLGGYYLCRGAESAHTLLQSDGGNTAFLKNKIKTARFYNDHILVKITALCRTVTDGAESVL